MVFALCLAGIEIRNNYKILLKVGDKPILSSTMIRKFPATKGLNRS